MDEYAYGYDRMGNRNYRENTQSTTKSEYHAYDALDRVTHTDRGTLNGGKTAITTLAFAQDWSLDQLGNWATFKTDNDGNGNYSSSGDLNHARAHNAANETGSLTTTYGSTWINPVHDAAGNMTEMPIPGTETSKHKAIYDGWNRLVQIKDNSNVIVVTYRYDGLNHRVRKLLGSNPASPTTTYDYYYNDSWQVMEERKDADTDPYVQYVWDNRYIDAPAVRFRDSNTDGTVDETHYYTTDANMNVTALVNASGTVQERYSYDSYGKVNIWDSSWSTRASSSYDNQILFGGYRFDPETSLYHVRNRMYHATLGRWASRDPLETGYQYTSSSPPGRMDPSGLLDVTYVNAPGLNAQLLGTQPAPPAGGKVPGAISIPEIPVLLHSAKADCTNGKVAYTSLDVRNFDDATTNLPVGVTGGLGTTVALGDKQGFAIATAMLYSEFTIEVQIRTGFQWIKSSNKDSVKPQVGIQARLVLSSSVQVSTTISMQAGGVWGNAVAGPSTTGKRVIATGDWTPKAVTFNCDAETDCVPLPPGAKENVWYWEKAIVATSFTTQPLPKASGPTGPTTGPTGPAGPTSRPAGPAGPTTRPAR